MIGKCFKSSSGSLPSLDDILKYIPHPKSLQPVPEPSRPLKSASWTSSHTHPRTTLYKAIKEDNWEPLTFLMDIWEQITTHTTGKKLKAYMERQIDNLGIRWSCIALVQASVTHKKRGEGLAYRFKTICEYEMPQIIAAHENRLLKSMEAEQERKQSQWEADESKRIATYEAERKAREEM